MRKYIYSRCDFCGHNNVHVVQTTGELAVHYHDLSVPYACKGSGKPAPERRDEPSEDRIIFDAAKLQRLRKALEAATTLTFDFEGNVFRVDYAHYLIEYLSKQLERGQS